jgi:hypothetical protein
MTVYAALRPNVEELVLASALIGDSNMTNWDPDYFDRYKEAMKVLESYTIDALGSLMPLDLSPERGFFVITNGKPCSELYFTRASSIAKAQSITASLNRLGDTSKVYDILFPINGDITEQPDEILVEQGRLFARQIWKGVQERAREIGLGEALGH